MVFTRKSKQHKTAGEGREVGKTCLFQCCWKVLFRWFWTDMPWTFRYLMRLFAYTWLILEMMWSYGPFYGLQHHQPLYSFLPYMGEWRWSHGTVFCIVLLGHVQMVQHLAIDLWNSTWFSLFFMLLNICMKIPGKFIQSSEVKFYQYVDDNQFYCSIWCSPKETINISEYGEVQ